MVGDLTRASRSSPIEDDQGVTQPVCRGHAVRNICANTQAPSQISAHRNLEANAERAAFIARKDAAGRLSHSIVYTRLALHHPGHRLVYAYIPGVGCKFHRCRRLRWVCIQDRRNWWYRAAWGCQIRPCFRILARDWVEDNSYLQRDVPHHTVVAVVLWCANHADNSGQYGVNCKLLYVAHI